MKKMPLLICAVLLIGASTRLVVSGTLKNMRAVDALQLLSCGMLLGVLITGLIVYLRKAKAGR